jgi:DNA-directed RNA polymerase specialized sigma24 family protein
MPPLTSWLRRRMRDAATAEDIAAETVLRAWQEFGAATPWSKLWPWALTTANRLCADAWRKRCRERTDSRRDMDLLPAAGDERPMLPLDAFLDLLQPRLAESEQQTLHLLRAGLTDNLQIASIRYLTVRAIQKSRRRLGDAAWKECRAVRLRASLPA